MEGLVKINLACGADYREGYTNVDDGSMIGGKVDVQTDIWDFNMPRQSVDEILLCHFMMYLVPTEALQLFERWCFTLKKGGKLVIETQDLKKLAKLISNSMNPAEINNTVVQFYGIGRTFGHKWTWCEETIKPLLFYAGFSKVEVTDGGSHNRPERDITITATKL